MGQPAPCSDPRGATLPVAKPTGGGLGPGCSLFPGTLLGIFITENSRIREDPEPGSTLHLASFSSSGVRGETEHVLWRVEWKSSLSFPGL